MTVNAGLTMMWKEAVLVDVKALEITENSQANL
jgi:hypothetical protein